MLAAACAAPPSYGTAFVMRAAHRDYESPPSPAGDTRTGQSAFECDNSV
jgi:hypothetical protein